jgi:putative acetyltransferase
VTPLPLPLTALNTNISDIQTLIVTEASDIAHVRALFLEYQHSLGLDLAFQDFEVELQNLPGDYQAPHGVLLLATVNNTPAGCCALRPLPNSDYINASEMKRLYVRGPFRGLGLGRLLVEHTLMHAKQSGYNHVLLDTLDDMEAARALYQDMGFVEVAPYYHNPLPGAHYLMAAL